MATHESSTTVQVLAALLLLAMPACSGTQTVPAPPNIPPITAPWGQLAAQIPASVDAALLISLDDHVREDLQSVFSALDLVHETSSLLSDTLGIDLDTPDAFDALGLRQGGGMGVFLYHDAWVALVDLDSNGPLYDLLDVLGQRNPDLDVSWRDGETGSVLTIQLPDDAGALQPRIHVALADDQVMAIYDLADSPDPDIVDELMEVIEEAQWGENLLYNEHFAESIGRFGADTWGLFFFDTQAVLRSLTHMEPSDRELSGLFGPPPEASRCAEADVALSDSIPYGVGAVRREEVTEADQTLVHESQQLHLRISTAFQERAERLLPRAPFDPAILESGAVMAGFLSVSPAELAEQFGSLADVASCGGPSALPGFFGQAADLLLDLPGLEASWNGLLAGALFDIRSTSGVPFADAFLMVGSPQPEALLNLLQEAFEAELGLQGTSETVAGFPTLHYRFALLYRLALYQGARALGVSLGRVEEALLQALLAPQTVAQSDQFAGFYINGPRLAQVFETIMEFSTPEVEDEEAQAAQLEMFEESLRDLQGLYSLRVDGRYDGGYVELSLDQLRFPTSPPAVTQAP